MQQSREGEEDESQNCASAVDGAIGISPASPVLAPQIGSVDWISASARASTRA